ncbi:uncharacterized protein B0H64DRAFT_366930 [Chaetomium fimeti]|uniref:Ankyrin repeat protein n=1 Tax=Chaetomium fimeti TaxID=1854472 RepID=A0AAE0H9R9_9PEZI|nr:hypothetical protein B0H64DRAFT_366930 [Chaetomium fimeti]
MAPPRRRSMERGCRDASRRRSSVYNNSFRSRRPTLDEEPDSVTCLSTAYHGPEAVRDLLQHYTGCIEISERVGFLNKNHEFWKKAKDELSHLEAKEQPPQNDSDALAALDAQVTEKIENSIKSLAVSIEAQYKRTDVLRKALAKEPTSPGSCSLVQHVNDSREAWQACKEFKDGIGKVKKWRRDKQPMHPGDVKIGDDRKDVKAIVEKLRGKQYLKEEVKDYELERDVNAYLIQYTRDAAEGNMTADGTGTADETASFDPKKRHLPVRQVDESLDDARFRGKFPDQRLAMSLLLGQPVDDTQSPGANTSVLSKRQCDGKDKTRVRYFHIPYNNMEWVERVIAEYYGDPRPNLSKSHIELQPVIKTQTEMLLRPQLWRGQQHGTQSGIVHARYMRPLCERVSTAVDVIEDNPSNIVLFMPYMYWETDRMRSAVCKMMEEESESQRKKQKKRESEDKTKRKKAREKITDKNSERRLEHPKPPPVPSQAIAPKIGAPLWSIADVLNRVEVGRTTQNGMKVDNGRLIAPAGRLGPLAQYLIDAARLYEAMSTFRDRRMLKDYLYKTPPLHPRRTLDQSHYWTLRSTRVRDRDQVVYRQTSMDVELAHKLKKIPLEQPPKQGLWGILQGTWPQVWGLLKGNAANQPDEAVSEIPERFHVSCCDDSDDKPEAQSHWPPWRAKGCKGKCHWQWQEHWSITDEDGCDHCTSDIKKTSKLIMVDQLWMWILDEQTIITSFPRRYGYNKHDAHGIHKSIRNRLRNARKNQVRSVYDLGLIVLDECSNTFLDRTRTHESQPQVMDIFSEAIGNVTNQHTTSFQHVWHWTKKASSVYRSASISKHYGETAELHVPLLDIHPEGKLQREIKDILDELEIMINLTRRQREIIGRYCKHVENILDPDGQLRNNGPDSQLSAQYRDDGFDCPDPSKRLSTGPETAGDRKKGKRTETQKQQEESEARRVDMARRKDHLAWFHMQSQDLLCEVDDHIGELEALRESAKSTAQSVTDLLSLKQQQASVVQAWESARQAEEAVRQGRAIMMFTIITIVFLPLSFMSSVFGMNNKDFGQDNTDWTVKNQFQLMFPISIGIVAVCLVVAFYPFLRAVIWSFYAYTTTLVVVKTGLYKKWLDFNDGWRSTTLVQKTEEEVFLLRDEVRKARRRKKAEEKAAERDKKNGGGQAERTDTEGGAGCAKCTGHSVLAWRGWFKREATTEDKDPEQQNGVLGQRPRRQPGGDTLQLPRVQRHDQAGAGAAGQRSPPSTVNVSGGQARE